MPLIALIAALGASLPAGHQAAVFWGGGRTWVADLDAPQLWVAEGWLAVDSGAQVWRYRLRPEAHRPHRAGPTPAPASRWTLLERAGLGERRWRALTARPTAPTGGGDQLQDERVVLQFLGDEVVVGRYRRDVMMGRARFGASVSTLRLPSGEALPLPAGAAAAAAWAVRSLGPAVEDCLRTPVGVMSWEQPGGQRGRWLALAHAEPGCEGRLQLLPLGRTAPPTLSLDGAEWDGHRLLMEGAAPLPGVVDLRAAPDGRAALYLRGAELSAPAGLRGDPLGLVDPCVSRAVWLWRAADPAHPVRLGAAPRLDGLRFLAPDDPLRALVGAYLRPADRPRCAGPVDDGPGAPSAELCRVDEARRAWGGPADLAAHVSLEVDRRFRLRVRVVDDLVGGGDAVRVWLGARHPLRVEVTAQPERRRRARRPVVTRWSPAEGGYEVVVEGAASLLGVPPALSVRITAEDGGAGALYLWAAGGRVDGRNPHPAPLAERP